MLSRITEPTEGYAEIHGRVGSLLEVGTGFHPKLTGRENITLNGAIPSAMLRTGLGMKRAEIDRKFDEIVASAVAAHRSTWLTAAPGARDHGLGKRCRKHQQI